jgi:hypothetical protein
MTATVTSDRASNSTMGDMIPKNWFITSRRPCPVMQYKATLLTWVTQRYRRVTALTSTAWK